MPGLTEQQVVELTKRLRERADKAVASQRDVDAGHKAYYSGSATAYAQARVLLMLMAEITESEVLTQCNTDSAAQ